MLVFFLIIVTFCLILLEHKCVKMQDQIDEIRKEMEDE